MKSLLLITACVLSACGTQYKTPAGSDTATLFVTGNNRNFFVEAYEDASCAPSKDGIRMATFFGPTKDVRADEEGKTIAIPAGKPFTFTHYYIDARFAQNRTCGITVSFTPERGKAYSSYFYVDPEVYRCDASINEGTTLAAENVASFAYNPSYCLGGENKGASNGQARWINWRVKIVRTPPKK